MDCYWLPWEPTVPSFLGVISHILFISVSSSKKNTSLSNSAGACPFWGWWVKTWPLQRFHLATVTSWKVDPRHTLRWRYLVPPSFCFIHFHTLNGRVNQLPTKRLATPIVFQVFSCEEIWIKCYLTFFQDQDTVENRPNTLQPWEFFVVLWLRAKVASTCRNASWDGRGLLVHLIVGNWICISEKIIWRWHCWDRGIPTKMS